MTNQQWLATISQEEWLNKIYWLYHIYGKRFDDTRLAVKEWLIQEHEEEKFRIIEVSTEHIIVNRKPMNKEERAMMQSAVMDELCREAIEKNTLEVIFPGKEKGED